MYTILYPSDYFDNKQVDDNYIEEYKTCIEKGKFNVVFYNHDDFLLNNKLTVYPDNNKMMIGIIRGWMLRPKEYEEIYIQFKQKNIHLINTPNEYMKMHLFPNIYNELLPYTPKTIWFEYGKNIDYNKINDTFDKFLIKDYVKSVKGHEFPTYFKTPVEKQEMEKYIEKFIHIRGDLFTEGLNFKEYVNLKKVNDTTNEYRLFCLKNKVLTLSQNSNQFDIEELSKKIDIDFIDKFLKFESSFYTIDFAELDNGEFVVIETGDGQVSGLSEKQNYNIFYEQMDKILN